jgi:aminoglycoside phosphotransferase (APT) family kinase protein
MDAVEGGRPPTTLSAGPSDRTARLRDGLAAYLEPRLGGNGPVTVERLARIPGGASRETWTFDANCPGPAGETSTEQLVLRLDPPASLLDTDREVEWAFYSSFFGSGVPVPRMRWLERDPSVLGGPFFIMDRIAGSEAQPRVLMEPRYEAVRPRVARRFYELLAAIHDLDWSRTAIGAVAGPPPPGGAWKEQLDRWEAIITANELGPQPIARAAIRWLRANSPPPSCRISVVHGDYRIGNVLVTPEGEINGVLDWEMAHLGDPLEDLAWSFNESWQWGGKDGRPGGVCTREEAISFYERSSGRPVDRTALAWWLVFSDVKCQGIWLTGARAFQEGRSNELILALIAYNLINAQDQAMLRALGKWR